MPNDFDAIAPFYPWLEKLLAGGVMHQARTVFLNEVPAATQVLLLGEGHGRALAAWSRRFPTAHFTCVDSSERMLKLARRRHEQARFIRADLLTWEPDETRYDLIIANFICDCFKAEQLESLIGKIAGITAPDAHWLIADFQTGERWRNRLIVGLLYRFFKFTARLEANELIAPDAYLLKAGFKRHQRRELDWGLLRSDWWRR